MYEKWIADDKEDLKLTKDQIAELRAKIDAVQNSQESSSEVLSHKEVLLSMKEDVLSVSCSRGAPAVPPACFDSTAICSSPVRATEACVQVSITHGTVSWYTVWWDTIS